MCFFTLPKFTLAKTKPENVDVLSTVITRKQWNSKTTYQYLSVFDVVTKQIVLPDTYQNTNLVKWVCLHCTRSVSCSLEYLKL